MTINLIFFELNILYGFQHFKKRINESFCRIVSINLNGLARSISRHNVCVFSFAFCISYIFFFIFISFCCNWPRLRISVVEILNRKIRKILTDHRNVTEIRCFFLCICIFFRFIKWIAHVLCGIVVVVVVAGPFNSRWKKKMH